MQYTSSFSIMAESAQTTEIACSDLCSATAMPLTSVWLAYIEMSGGADTSPSNSVLLLDLKKPQKQVTRQTIYLGSARRNNETICHFQRD